MTGRFDFALEHVPATQWHAFERLARAFMADDYVGFRAVASAAGDGGRDGLIFLVDEDESTAIQISLASDWNDKIRRTVRRLDNTHPQVQELIYLTNQTIGPAADQLKRELRKSKSVSVDIRDRSWFVDREFKSPATTASASAFAALVVDPLLSQAEVFDRGHSLLSDHESRAALLYLVMQSKDDSQERGLTKLCFDSLARTALRSTDNDNRMTRDQIHAWVLSVLPTHESSEVVMYVDRALERLDRRYIRHWRKEDEFCMNHDERVRLTEKVAELLAEDQAFDSEIRLHAAFVAQSLELVCGDDALDDVTERSRRVLEQFLFERGEAFVNSVRKGDPMLFSQSEILDLAKRDTNLHPDNTYLRHNMATLVGETVERTILGISEASNVFLRAISDAYTLFAFLCETPNVQSAVSKLFSQGEFWLDTSAVLPLLVEDLLEEPERRNSFLIRAVRSAGAKVMVTSGVVEELLHHIDHSLRAWRSPTTWRGRTPFLYSSYLWSGHPNDGFRSWLETFRGERRPDLDLAEYLLERHGIQVVDLTEQAASADETLRWHTMEYWRSVHERRQVGEAVDPEVLRQLTERDVENFLGVYQLRHRGEEVGNVFGYRHWWLSLTRPSVEAAEAIRSAAGLKRLDSPVLSYEFLTRYLTVGPARSQLAKSLEQRLPMMMETSLLDAPPTVLLDIAESVRRDLDGQDELTIRRKIRDQLEAEKLSRKRIGKAGIDAIIADLRAALTAQAKRKEVQRA